MSRRARRGLVLAALHVAIVAGLGARLLIERAVRPRVWAAAAPVDPDLPIRGRYVRLRVEADVAEGSRLPPAPERAPVELTVRNSRLVASPAQRSRVYATADGREDGRQVAVVSSPLAYFIPDGVPDPSLLQPGEELWVEVTVPARGAPRPIRLGLRRGGTITPLGFD